jgi:hypothetical protein
VSGMPPRSATLRTVNGRPAPRKHSGFGGFPMPHEILRSGVKYFFPKLERKITRTVTFQRTGTFQRPGGLPMNRTATMASGRSYTGTINPAGSGAPVPVPYISFDAVVGRNSRFRDLTSEQMEELGGVEYRALKVLLVIVPSVRTQARLSRSPDDCVSLTPPLPSGSTVPADHADFGLGHLLAVHRRKGSVRRRLRGAAEIRPHRLVRRLPVGLGLQQHGHVARRSVDGPLSKGVPHDLRASDLWLRAAARD